MKVAKMLLAGAICGVAVLGVAGCSGGTKYVNLDIQNAKVAFSVGEQFSVSNDMSVKVVTNKKDAATGDWHKVLLEQPRFLKHDQANKKYWCQQYIIDYSEFDSSQATNANESQKITVTFVDGDDNPNNDIITDFDVEIVATSNALAPSSPAITIDESWQYGVGPQNLVAPVALHNQNGLTYSIFRQGFSDEFTNANADTVIQTLTSLDAGQYFMEVFFSGYELDQQGQSKKIYEQVSVGTLYFAVQRVTLPASLLADIIIPDQVYTGDSLLQSEEFVGVCAALGFDLGGNQYYDVFPQTDMVNAGEQLLQVSLNSVNYKWADTDLYTKEIRFNIVPAANMWEPEYDTLQYSGTVMVGAETKTGWSTTDSENMFDAEKLTLPQAVYGGEIEIWVKVKGTDDMQYEQYFVENLDGYELKDLPSRSEGYTIKVCTSKSITNYAYIEKTIDVWVI